MQIPVGEASRAVHAVLIGDEQTIARGVSYDSRSLTPGNLFVAVVAQRDGHDFVPDAVRAGAAGVLVSREIEDCPVAQILVPDTEVAIVELGRWARAVLADRIAGRVVGITGSVGKTTTKDFVATALRTKFSVGASEKSLNNDLGLPVTILNAPDDVEALVLEMGMRGFGEIARLASLALPDIGIVTRVGESHSERVGGIDGVRRAKSELVESIGPNGFVLLNADDPLVAGMRALASGTVLTFGSAEGADMRIVSAEQNGTTGVSFRYASRWGAGECALSVPGMHMVSNAAAALLAAAVVGCDLEAAASAFRRVELSPMRMAIHEVSGRTIIDDSYNASPTSVNAALDTLAAMPATHRVAVLGTMAEIDEADRRHRDVAAHAESLGIDVVAYGTDLYGTRRVDDPTEVVAMFRSLPEGAAVLFKASRVVGLDHVVRNILG